MKIYDLELSFHKMTNTPVLHFNGCLRWIRDSYIFSIIKYKEHKK